MKAVKDFAGFFSGSLLALFIAAIAGYSQKPPDQTAQMIRMSVTTTDPPGNPCDEMAFMAGMNVMGESMAAMTNHMCITPIWPKEPGDEDKAKAVVAQVRTTIEKSSFAILRISSAPAPSTTRVTPTRGWRVT